ncbi:uncharacterized protein LOC118195908 [Stegodyphus dumicola]|nr:uncharacterized protein LOC118195908 [Stegodyphus dumicola]
MEANLSELEVMKFLIEKGGRCTNYELVSNFRAVLNNPLYQAEARVKFKDIINTVATVGEYENVKYIELKQEYRDNNCNQQENFSSVSSSLSSEGSSYTSPLTQNFQPYWRYRLSTSTRVPTLPSRSPEYENVLLQSSRETCPSPSPIQFNRSVSESTLSHPVKNHPHHEDGSSPTRRQRGLSASSFNRSFLENHYRNQTPHLEENQPIRRVSVSDLDTSNRIAYNKSQANYSPERPHNLYGRHFNGILKNPPPSNHEFNRTVSESIPLRPPETYFEGDIGLPQHPMFRRPSHHSATDLNRSELAQPAIADDCSVRTTKRSGICNDEILLKLQEDNYSKTSSTPISMCINRMHGIPAKDSFHDIPVSVFSETPVSTSISRSDAKGSFHSTSVPECTETSVSASINRMHGIHAKNSFNGISRSEYSEMPVSTSVNRSDAQDTFRHTPVSEYSDTSVSASINRMHGIHERDSFHDDTFSKQPDGSFPLENSNLNNASECTDFRKREQIEKFGTTSRNTISASIPKTAYQYHNSTGNNLKETVADDLSSTSCVSQKNFQCDNYQKEEISLRTPFSGLDVYSNHSDSLNLGNETAASNQRVLGNLENSIQNCVEQHEKPPPLPPERRRKSQDRSRVDVDVSDNNSTEQMLEKGIVTVTGKVKDRVQHFDDMEKKRNTKRCLSPLPDKENRMTKSAGMEDDISISALDPKLKREWFVKAAQGDYHALVGLLKKEPKLAAIKDIGSGVSFDMCFIFLYGLFYAVLF